METEKVDLYTIIAELIEQDPKYGNLMWNQYLFLKQNIDHVTNKVEKAYKDVTVQGKPFQKKIPQKHLLWFIKTGRKVLGI